MQKLNQEQGFSLIELMIVLAIIAILSVIAIPSYQKYLDRARFSEITTAVEPFKLAVTLALQEGKELSELKNGEAGIPAEPKSTKNIDSIKVDNGTITATAAPSLKSATFILKPANDGSHFTLTGTCLKLGLCHE